MSTPFVLTPQHGYPVCVCLFYFCCITFYMPFFVMRARKTYDVKYPLLYADPKDNKNADAFNCIQRAHQNRVENLGGFLALLFCSSIQTPVTAAIAGAVYVAGSLAYFNGYKTGVPKKRNQGAFFYFGLLTLVFLTGKLAFSLLTS